MRCPFLAGRYMLSCAVNSKKVYVPSVFELEEYCKSSRYKICPLYCGARGEWYSQAVQSIEKARQQGAG